MMLWFMVAGGLIEAEKFAVMQKTLPEVTAQEEIAISNWSANKKYILWVHKHAE